MEYIYLLKYNNYYNRIATAPISLQYINEHTEKLVHSNKINFVPGDGVNTEIILNINDDINCNYLVVANDTLTAILSRWFVIECIRTRGGQYRVQLHRDLIADAYNDVLTAPMFIEKATLSNNDSFIFNSENMAFNQIKKQEILLKEVDNYSKRPWIVGYMARNTQGSYELTLQEKEADFNMSTTSSAEFIAAHPNLKILSDVKMRVCNYFNKTGVQSREMYNVFNSLGKIKSESTYGINYFFKFSYREDYEQTFDFDYSNLFSWSYVKQQISVSKSYDTTDSLSQYDGKTILFSDGIFKFNLRRTTTETDWTRINNSFNPTLTSHLQNAIIQAYNDEFEHTYTSTSNVQGNPIEYYGYVDTLSFTLTEDNDNYSGTLNLTLSASRTHLNDAPYDMFYLEYTNKNFQFVTLLMEKLGAAIYDVQLLPYCPELERYKRIFDLGNTNGEVVVYKSGNIYYTSMYFAEKSTANYIFDCNNINYALYKLTPDSDLKIENECKLYRLCSPNYSGAFEFSVAKNLGVDKWKIDITYKPFTPYIHVYPVFKNLYGNDFADARGLLVGGDFSIARVTDAWSGYEVQNKYYQQIFDRNIQSMEFKNNIAFASDIIGSSVGALGGAATGFALGGVPGAIGGGLASAAGGVADVAINRSIRNEALDYTKDMYGYNLATIKALPQSVSKTSAFTANNKLYPFIEVYDCTDEEKEALKNKLKWNGMTVMRIGTIDEFLLNTESYIKGKLIRLESDAYDNHYTNSLANELNQGVFIKREVIE